MTKVSSKGQIVIPLDIRKKAKLKEGEKLLAYSDKDTIVLKRLNPSISEFRKIASFGKSFAKRKKIKLSNVLEDD